MHERYFLDMTETLNQDNNSVIQSGISVLTPRFQLASLHKVSARSWATVLPRLREVSV